MKRLLLLGSGLLLTGFAHAQVGLRVSLTLSTLAAFSPKAASAPYSHETVEAHLHLG